MSFTPNIPQSGQSLGQTRNDIKNNFSNYNTLVSVDHVAPNAAGQGQHKQTTLNTYLSTGAVPVVGPFAPAGTQSWVYSYNASAAGTQLVYQPSITQNQVPCSPRSLARVLCSAPGTWALDNGPYGTGTNFNALTPVNLVTGGFTYTFAQPLISADYFVFPFAENGVTIASINTKTVNGFNVNIVSPLVPSAGRYIFMVY